MYSSVDMRSYRDISEISDVLSINEVVEYDSIFDFLVRCNRVVALNAGKRHVSFLNKERAITFIDDLFGSKYRFGCVRSFLNGVYVAVETIDSDMIGSVENEEKVTNYIEVAQYEGLSIFYRPVYLVRRVKGEFVDRLEVVRFPEYTGGKLVERSYEEFEFSFCIQESGTVYTLDRSGELTAKIVLFDRLNLHNISFENISGFRASFPNPISARSRRKIEVNILSSFKFEVYFEIVVPVRRYDRNEIYIKGVYDIFSEKWYALSGHFEYVDGH